MYASHLLAAIPRDYYHRSATHTHGSNNVCTLSQLVNEGADLSGHNAYGYCNLGTGHYDPTDSTLIDYPNSYICWLGKNNNAYRGNWIDSTIAESQYLLLDLDSVKSVSGIVTRSRWNH